MKAINPKSPFAPYIEGLLAQKRSDGYSYDAEEKMLESFDNFCIEQGFTEDVITRKIFMSWAEQRETEGLTFRARRAMTLRQLALYMRALGKDAYVSNIRFSKEKNAVHVISAEELISLFTVIDTSCNENPSFRFFNLEYRLLFRLYYCCGMRLSEGVKLTKQDVDCSDGSITILQSKGRKDRVVYITDDLRELCIDYLEAMKHLVPDTPWVFPSKDPSKHLVKHNVCRKFREFWMKTPYAADCDKRPTPHCLRHTYVVDKMNEWMAEGKDLGVMMAYLSSHLGHSTMEETYYYYHQANKAFNVIREKDVLSSVVIPGVDDHDYC
jgi:integrase